MKFPITTEELVEVLCNGSKPTEQDMAYAEALSKLSDLSYAAGYQAGSKDSHENCIAG